LLATLKALQNKASSPQKTRIVVAFVETPFESRQAAADEGSQGTEAGVGLGWSKAFVFDPPEWLR
jgi:hypothetical protein